jgi:hypothetical protein
MPVQFQFVGNDGNPRLLPDIDEEICAFVGQEPDEVEFSMYYNVLTWIGIGALVNQGGSKITKEILDAYFVEVPAKDGKLEAVAYEFLVNRYEFHAWR